MQRFVYSENDLPFQQMEGLGLASGRRLLVSREDLEALLCGRRTDLLKLKGPALENIGIRRIKAKLSLRSNEAGHPELLIHPVYKKPNIPDILSQAEAKELESLWEDSILTFTENQRGDMCSTLVEYDRQTREYIFSDTSKVPVPESVNSRLLTADQKEQYQGGGFVRLPDETVFRYRGLDRNGIESNKPALVATFLSGEVRTFIHFQELNSFLGLPHEPTTAAQAPSAGYRRALKKMNSQQKEDAVQRDDKIESGPARNRSGRGR